MRYFDHMRYFAELCEEPGWESDPATALRELAAQATQLDSPLFTSLQKATSDTTSKRLGSFAPLGTNTHVSNISRSFGVS